MIKKWNPANEVPKDDFLNPCQIDFNATNVDQKAKELTD